MTTRELLEQALTVANAVSDSSIVGEDRDTLDLKAIATTLASEIRAHLAEPSEVERLTKDNDDLFADVQVARAERDFARMERDRLRASRERAEPVGFGLTCDEDRFFGPFRTVPEALARAREVNAKRSAAKKPPWNYQVLALVPVREPESEEEEDAD